MTIVFFADDVVGDGRSWQTAMAKRLPERPFKIAPDMGDREAVEYVLQNIIIYHIEISYFCFNSVQLFEWSIYSEEIYILKYLK